jgi:hypothetical protein
MLAWATVRFISHNGRRFCCNNGVIAKPTLSFRQILAQGNSWLLTCIEAWSPDQNAENERSGWRGSPAFCWTTTGHEWRAVVDDSVSRVRWITETKDICSHVQSQKIENQLRISVLWDRVQRLAESPEREDAEEPMAIPPMQCEIQDGEASPALDDQLGPFSLSCATRASRHLPQEASRRISGIR